MRLTKGTVVWAAIGGKPSGPWLWSARQDRFWIAGGASLLFGLIATPITIVAPIAAGALVTAFLHLAVVCNYPHYASTYQLIVRERGRARSSFLLLLASIPVAVAAVVAGALRPGLIGPTVRLYLTWSAYHYAAQHFGIASMYQARSGDALASGEKRVLQVGFVGVAVHLMLVLNMTHGLGSDSAFGVRGGDAAVGALLPTSAYPLALVGAVVGCGAYAAAEHLHRRRTGRGLGSACRLLFATNFAWFVLPFARVPGAHGPWMGASVATWLPFALPFFHCAQYLGVTAWRARTTGQVKPIYLFMLLVIVGLGLFEGITAALPRVSSLDGEQALLLVPAVLNIHHFFLDGLMWKARRRPAPVAEANAPPDAIHRFVDAP